MLGFLDSKFVKIFMTLITIYALFGDDLRAVAFRSEVDEIFYSVSSACMGFFVIEIILSSLVKPDYFLGFYFWLDIIGTVSIVFDIGWIMDPITNPNVSNA